MPNEKRNVGPVILAYVVGLLLAAGVVTAGCVLANRGQGFALLATGLAAVIAVLVTFPLALLLFRIHQSHQRMREEMARFVPERLQQISVLLQLVSEQQLLSDRTKAVAFRENDREALRRAIQEEMARGDWEAALVLANGIETEFGYRQEADGFRQIIRDKHREASRKQVTEAVLVVDRLARGEQWTAAFAEAERLLTLFADDPQVQNLPQELQTRRNAHKKRLMDNWSDALSRHDVDGGIEILKQLDSYLTGPEAEAMQEQARGLFKEKLENLRLEFVGAVKDHKWPEAIRVGEQIMRDFPNSRIALEVRQKMDALRQRAAEPATAGV